MNAEITGLGHAIPTEKIDNHFFKNVLKLETSDKWIQERTGIKYRHFCKKNTSTSDLGTQAALKCIENNQTDSTKIDLIITATSTPDYLSFPSTACLIQSKLNISNCAAFDISAACSGFCYGLTIANSFIQSKTYSKILVIGVDLLSRITNFKDRSTCILFADGAGAALIEPTKNKDEGIIYSKLYADGNEAHTLLIPEGGSKNPLSVDVIKNNKQFIHMDGKAIFKSAINKVVPAIKEALETIQLTINDISYLICHQANSRILHKIAEQLNLPQKKLIINVTNYGNTSAATIPLALSELNQKKILKKGDIIILAGFGAGFTWGVNIIKWSK